MGWKAACQGEDLGLPSGQEEGDCECDYGYTDCGTFCDSDTDCTGDDWCADEDRRDAGLCTQDCGGGGGCIDIEFPLAECCTGTGLE
jgi:hypothetical protein